MSCKLYIFEPSCQTCCRHLHVTSLHFCCFLHCALYGHLIHNQQTEEKKAWKKHKRIPTIVIDLVQTLTLLFIFATALCFGLVIGAAGALANYGTNRNSPYPTLSNLVTPLALAAFGWILRKTGSQWLQYNAIASADEEVNCNTNEFPLLQWEPESTSSNSV